MIGCLKSSDTPKYNPPYIVFFEREPIFCNR